MVYFFCILWIGGDNIVKKKKKKKKYKCKIRIFFALLVFGSVTFALSYNLVNNVVIINQMKLKKIELATKIDELHEEKKILETDIMKLEDSDYIAKYVREKYFYSKDGEYILRMDN